MRFAIHPNCPGLIASAISARSLSAPKAADREAHSRILGSKSSLIATLTAATHECGSTTLVPQTTAKDAFATTSRIVGPLLATHFFNHQTHHRGQGHAALTYFGHDPGDTDLPLVLLQV
ncbi:DinB family protein [Reyranella sp.]|uniref:DinB family protein n=1 Tax=Reyranella sp. TaxID=1929291 RepID=UPI003D0DAB89